LDGRGTLHSGVPSQLLVMDQRSAIRRPSGHAEGEERQRRGDGDRGSPRTDQRHQCRDAGRLRRYQETLCCRLVRTDGILIDSFDLSDRITGRASGEEDRDRADSSDDHHGERGAQERRAAHHSGRQQKRRREELAEYRSVIEYEVEVDGVGKLEGAHSWCLLVRISHTYWTLTGHSPIERLLPHVFVGEKVAEGRMRGRLMDTSSACLMRLSTYGLPLPNAPLIRLRLCNLEHR